MYCSGRRRRILRAGRLAPILTVLVCVDRCLELIGMAGRLGILPEAIAEDSSLMLQKSVSVCGLALRASSILLVPWRCWFKMS